MKASPVSHAALIPLLFELFPVSIDAFTVASVMGSGRALPSISNIIASPQSLNDCLHVFEGDRIVSTSSCSSSPPPPSSSFHDASTTLFLSMMEDWGGYVVPAALLLLAAGAFLYANVVYTPEIIAANQEMRLQVREAEIQKLLAVVLQHKTDGLDLEELRVPLEASFGTTVEEYVAKVDEENVSPSTTTRTTVAVDLKKFTSADEELADILRTMSRPR